MAGEDKQLFEIVERRETSLAPGDYEAEILDWENKEMRGVLLRPVEPQPANPWINDRLPTKEDVDELHGEVIYWHDIDKRASAIDYTLIEPHDYWRKIDQTPPPADLDSEPEPTPKAKVTDPIIHQACVVVTITEGGQLIVRSLGMGEEPNDKAEQFSDLFATCFGATLQMAFHEAEEQVGLENEEESEATNG